MKRLLILSALIFSSAFPSWPQGTISFNNHVPPLVDAKVFSADGVIGLGAGWTAQLWVGKDVQQLTPVTPTTEFLTDSFFDLGYVKPVTLDIPGTQAGDSMLAAMVVSLPNHFFQFSNLFPITLGGNGNPPALLVGLKSFSVPEPCTSWLSFVVMAFVIIFIFRQGQISNIDKWVFQSEN